MHRAAEALLCLHTLLKGGICVLLSVACGQMTMRAAIHVCNSPERQNTGRAHLALNPLTSSAGVGVGARAGINPC